MRRTFASFLLAVISLPPIAASMCEGALSSSPACCRRDGKHHCDVAGMHSASDGPAAVAERCQSWQRLPIASLSLNALSAAGAESGSLLAPALLVFHFSPQRRLYAPEGSTKKRGPPLVLD